MDVKRIAHLGADVERQVVAGRVLQHDTDFYCYSVADLEKSLSQNFNRLLEKIRFDKALSGAQFVNCHVTLGTKSGRENMATVKPYQENRDPDLPIKVRVREIRNMIANYTGKEFVPVYDLNYEADDVMIQMQHAQIKKHGWDSSVIISGDKDLWMGMGWHCDTEGNMWMVKGYGHTAYREVGNVKPKLVGEGRSWFWHQMIMGDKADNIPGLEQISNRDLDRYFPLKSKKPRANGYGKCGEAKAVEVLKGVTTDYEAILRTWELYSNRYGREAEERFMEQAYLLWMQRTDDPYDAEKYLQKMGGNFRFSPPQRYRIDQFIADKNS